MNEHEWESVNVTETGTTTERLKIEGGWLYHVCIKSYDRMFHTTMCFVPDSHIKKALDSLPAFKAGEISSIQKLSNCKHGLGDRCALCDAIPGAQVCDWCSRILSAEERDAVKNNVYNTPKTCYACWNKTCK